MQFEFGKTALKLTFPFAAVVTLMLLLCDEEIVLISLFSSFFHEGGHLLLMIVFSEKPRRIVLGAFGIRIERCFERVTDYRKEAAICLGGVFGNIILSGFSLIVYYFTESSFSLKLLAVNIFIACFNLIPIRQLDAGRCIEAILEAKLSAEGISDIFKIVSVVFSFILLILCVCYNVFFGLNVSLIAVTLYLICISKF